jgi:hypothetical protein
MTRALHPGINAMQHGVILLLFGLSGFASLVYQVLWLKELGLLFGSTTDAASARRAFCPMAAPVSNDAGRVRGHHSHYAGGVSLGDMVAGGFFGQATHCRIAQPDVIDPNLAGTFHGTGNLSLDG